VKSLVAVLVLVIVARTASAQPGATEPIPEGSMESPPVYVQPQWQPQRQPSGTQKSEDTALWLSLGGTLGSYALLIIPSAIAAGSYNQSANQLASAAGSVGLVGTLLAPSFGHWYAGKGFTRGFGLRLGAMPVAVLGLLVAISGCSWGYSHGDESNNEGCGSGEPIGIAILLGAGAMWVGCTVDDIVQAPRRVRRNNGAQYALTPLLQRDGAGLALAGTF
jgi:hypothetical protein